MPVVYTFDATRNAVFGALTDPVTVEDWESALTELLGSGVPADVRTLWDLRAMDFRNVDRRTLAQINEFRRRSPGRTTARLALVVADDFAFGMARMFELMSAESDGRIMVFRDYDEAVAWLLLER
ncbi:MAG: hypothetical protein AB1635_16880 [Acidobacteriota bacterium]